MKIVYFRKDGHGLVLETVTELRIKEEHNELLYAFSQHYCIFFHRESFEHNCTTQTNSKTEALWDHSTSSACWTGLESNQSAEIPGED